MIAFGRPADRDLMLRFRAGDRDAFTAIYRSHSPAIHRFALHMTADPAKAAEITQDVFVWLIHHPDGFDPKRGELGAFLTGVARKHVQRRWQQERRWVPFEEAVTRTVAEADTEAGQDTDKLRARSRPCPRSTGKWWCCAIWKRKVMKTRRRHWSAQRARSGRGCTGPEVCWRASYWARSGKRRLQ